VTETCTSFFSFGATLGMVFGLNSTFQFVGTEPETSTSSSGAGRRC
jgi:hypothetical protein